MTGFKSFAEPEHISIDDGMTGIVGPNGCGKSNIVEGLRWLMGESSAKSMRGGELEDIIFAGSDIRPARNFAEVTLTLDNSGTLDSANIDGDIEVTRRIERGKGSSFKINGKPSRGRDVQLLFADMATGARSSGIVSQGKVGALINAKPVERRKLLEEAANIRGLHQRRHEAELRLNTAQGNLDRLEDILTQLDEQKNNLAKQARQAARYRSIADRIRKAGAHLMLARFTAAMARLDETETLLRSAERLTAAATEDALHKARHRDTIAETLPSLRQQEVAAAAELQRYNLERNALDQEEERAKKAVLDVTSRRAQIATDTAREQQLLTDADHALALLKKEQAATATANDEDEPKRKAAAIALDEARIAAAEAEQVLADATAKSHAAERESQSIYRQIAENTARLKQAEDSLAALNLDTLKTMADTHTATHDKAVETAATCKAKRIEREAYLEGAAAAMRKAHDEKAKQNENLTRVKAEVEALTALLLPAADGHGNSGDGTPVSASISVSGGVEAGLAAVLGDDLIAPIAASPPPNGRHNNAYWQDRKGAKPMPPVGAVPLAEYLDLPDALIAATAGVGVAENDTIAAAMQAKLTPGQAITTVKGGLWRWDGFVQPIGATTNGAQTNAAGRLKQEARLRVLTADLDGLEKTANTAAALAAQQANAHAELEAEIQILRRDERNSDHDLINATRADETAKAAFQSALRRHDELTENLIILEKAAASATAEASNLSRPDALHLDVENSALKAEECRQKLAEAMGSDRAIRTARDGRDQRMGDITREELIWTERQGGAHIRLDELANRRQQAEDEAEQLAGQPDDISHRRHQLEDAIDRAEQARQHAADALAAAEKTLNLAAAAARQADQVLAAGREDYIRRESARDLALQEQTSIINRIQEQLNITPDVSPDGWGGALRDMAGLAPDDAIDTDDDALNVLESRHERLLRERENIGPVNLRAEAEIAEVEARITGINTERDDLTAAITKLRSAINQLNREGRARLLKSFADVNKYFETLFKTLFNGGTAELSLTNTDDPLEAGLEILASPPGKKMQSLSLLSGGEQALTALALIFAVFLTNPSPICILDEVDAPLDDTNVARFCDMLGQIADETGTRFIVVTHHRLTMAKMDRLYGVTMEQKGVSRVVSVDLQTAEKYKKIA